MDKTLIAFGLILSACNLKPVAPTTPAETDQFIISTSTVLASSPGMLVHFVDMTEGDAVPAGLGADGRPLVIVKLEVTGKVPTSVSLLANGLPAVDSGGHPLEALNPTGALPFSAEIPWSPARGGGEYTLVISAMDQEKQIVAATVKVMVTGIPVFTLTPPPPDMAEAQQRISELILEQFGVSIPKPSVYRFNSPQNPQISRWIGSAYYHGTRYYIDLYDDTHYSWSNAEYSDTAQQLNTDTWVLCRPNGIFHVLTIFVDYGNTGANRDDVLRKVPLVVNWLNGLYTIFATSQGYFAPLILIEADSAFVSPPPTTGEFLTGDQILSLTGKDPSNYEFLMEIDLDANSTIANRYFSNVLEPGGGVALQGCGNRNKFGIANIWSSITDSSAVVGGLVMDFNHELSHLFGMMDNWPFIQSSPGPDGLLVDDWIPYVMFGWSDSDGDGIPEIIDSTPYDTTDP